MAGISPVTILKNLFDNLATGQSFTSANYNAGNSVGGGQYLTIFQHDTYLYN